MCHVSQGPVWLLWSASIIHSLSGHDQSGQSPGTWHKLRLAQFSWLCTGTEVLTVLPKQKFEQHSTLWPSISNKPVEGQFTSWMHCHRIMRAELRSLRLCTQHISSRQRAYMANVNKQDEMPLDRCHSREGCPHHRIHCRDHHAETVDSPPLPPPLQAGPNTVGTPSSPWEKQTSALSIRQTRRAT